MEMELEELIFIIGMDLCGCIYSWYLVSSPHSHSQFLWSLIKRLEVLCTLKFSTIDWFIIGLWGIE